MSFDPYADNFPDVQDRSLLHGIDFGDTLDTTPHPVITVVPLNAQNLLRRIAGTGVQSKRGALSNPAACNPIIRSPVIPVETPAPAPIRYYIKGTNFETYKSRPLVMTLPTPTNLQKNALEANSPDAFVNASNPKFRRNGNVLGGDNIEITSSGNALESSNSLGKHSLPHANNGVPSIKRIRFAAGEHPTKLTLSFASNSSNPLPNSIISPTPFTPLVAPLFSPPISPPSTIDEALATDQTPLIKVPTTISDLPKTKADCRILLNQIGGRVDIANGDVKMYFYHQTILAKLGIVGESSCPVSDADKKSFLGTKFEVCNRLQSPTSPTISAEQLASARIEELNGVWKQLEAYSWWRKENLGSRPKKVEPLRRFLAEKLNLKVIEFNRKESVYKEKNEEELATWKLEMSSLEKDCSRYYQLNPLTGLIWGDTYFSDTSAARATDYINSSLSTTLPLSLINNTTINSLNSSLSALAIEYKMQEIQRVVSHATEASKSTAIPTISQQIDQTGAIMASLNDTVSQLALLLSQLNVANIAEKDEQLRLARLSKPVNITSSTPAVDITTSTPAVNTSTLTFNDIATLNHQSIEQSPLPFLSTSLSPSTTPLTHHPTSLPESSPSSSSSITAEPKSIFSCRLTFFPPFDTYREIIRSASLLNRIQEEHFQSPAIGSDESGRLFVIPEKQRKQITSKNPHSVTTWTQSFRSKTFTVLLFTLEASTFKSNEDFFNYYSYEVINHNGKKLEKFPPVKDLELHIAFRTRFFKKYNSVEFFREYCKKMEASKLPGKVKELVIMKSRLRELESGGASILSTQELFGNLLDREKYEKVFGSKWVVHYETISQKTIVKPIEFGVSTNRVDLDLVEKN